MLATTSPALWYLTRGTGIMSLLLLTLATVLGILTAGRAASAAYPRFAVSELHRRVSLLAVVFVCFHVVSAVLDTFVHISFLAIVIPFFPGYAPGWVGLGAMAIDLLAAVTVTSLLRTHLPARLWRAVHWAAYLSWPLAVAHSLGIGSDMRFGWLQAVVALCIVAVLGALGWRIWARPHRLELPTADPQAPAGQRRNSRPVIPDGPPPVQANQPYRRLVTNSNRTVRR